MMKYINSICDVIAKAYPTSPIYIEGVPSEFERPSFFVQFVAGDEDDMNISTYMDNLTFQIVYFGEYNEFQNVDVEKQLTEFGELKKLFSKGYLPLVGEDRVAKISHVTVAKREAEVYIDLDFMLAEARELPKEDYKLMGKLDFKYHN